MISWFVRSGLASGDRVWCFPNGCRSEVLSWLRRNDIGDDALASGQLTVLPTHESALSALDSGPDRVIDGLRRAIDDALDDGWNGFRMVGDLGWAIRGRSCSQQLIDFESQIGEVLAEAPAATLCQYDRHRFDVDTMTALAKVHAAVVGTLTVPTGEELLMRPLPDLPGLRLAGEVDLATRQVFTDALDAAVNDTGDLHLELSELTFIDHHGVQVLLRAAQRLGPDRRMVVHRPPRSLTLALDLFWDIPNLVVVDKEPA